MALDKDGRVFLDFNPNYFAVILDYLREKAFTTSEAPMAFSKITPEEVESFCKLVDYLGLSLDEMWLPKFPKTEAFQFHSAGIKLAENGAVANSTSLKSCRVVGQNIYERGVSRIKLIFDERPYFNCEASEIVVRSKKS